MFNIQKKVVIAAQDSGNDWMYFEDMIPSTNSVTYSWTFTEATDLSDASAEEIAIILEKCILSEPGLDWKIQSIKVDVDEEYEENSDIKELRQMIALKKLNISEIKALGLLKTHVYMKTKYHQGAE